MEFATSHDASPESSGHAPAQYCIGAQSNLISTGRKFRRTTLCVMHPTGLLQKEYAMIAVDEEYGDPTM